MVAIHCRAAHILWAAFLIVRYIQQESNSTSSVPAVGIYFATLQNLFTTASIPSAMSPRHCDGSTNKNDTLPKSIFTTWWSRVTNYNLSLRSDSSKYSRPHLICFFFSKRKNMIPVSTSARKQRRLLAKTKQQPPMWLLFCFAAVLPPGIEPGSQIPQTCILSIKLWERWITPKREVAASYLKTLKIQGTC